MHIYIYNYNHYTLYMYMNTFYCRLGDWLNSSACKNQSSECIPAASIGRWGELHCASLRLLLDDGGSFSNQLHWAHCTAY